MKLFTPQKDQSLSTTNFLEHDHDLTLSKTPRKNKTEKLEIGTASNLELTPLVSPARLNWNYSLLSQTLRLEVVQTPLFHRSNLIPSIDHEGFDPRQVHEIQTRVLFDKDECQEQESSPFGQEDAQSEKDNQSDNENEGIDSKEFQPENQVQKNPFLEISFKRLPQSNLEEPKTKDSESKKCLCNCKRTQCLKLYCDCFREGQVCGSGCQCNDCHNSTDYQAERIQVKQVLMKRNPEAFRRKIQNNQHSKGCNCKKTGCLKKYCQCYQAGLECGDHCKCEECKNGLEGKVDSYEKEERFKYTVKKERRMKEL